MPPADANVFLLFTEPLESRRSIEVGGHTIRVAAPEYVIVRKLQFFAEAVVTEWATRLGLEEVWQKVREAAR